MRLSAFGRLEAADEAGVTVPLGRPKQRLVLALLIAEGGRTVPTSRLLDVLWDDDGDKERAALYSYISNLRRALEPNRTSVGPTSILRDDLGYRLGVARADVDILRFEDLVARGLRREHGNVDERATLLERAVQSWTDGPLREFADCPPIFDACNRWRSLLGRALDELSQHRLVHGGESLVIAELGSRIAEFPLDEGLATHLAVAHYRLGQQADALRALARVREALMETSGLDPGDGLRLLEQRILAQAPDLAAPAQPARGITRPSAVPDLIGRDREIAQLVESLDAAASGHGRAIGVVAEAGAGKSALVEHFVQNADATVGFVRCPEGVAMPPYWPLRRLGAMLGDEVLPVDDLVSRGTTEPFLVAAHLADSLRRSRATRLLVVDDVQWADQDTLSVLAHLVASLHTTSTLLVLTARPLTNDSSAALVSCLAELTRQGAGQMQLVPLTVHDIAAWIRRRSGRADADRLAVDVHWRTEGNALFARELIELLASDDDIAAGMASGEATRLHRIPPGIGAVVRRRVARLPSATQRLLTVAAVVGAEFGLETVADVLDIGVSETLHRFEPALADGMVKIDAHHGFSFSHSLVADALASEVNAARSAEIHAAAARSLWDRAPDVEHAAQVARHAVAGALAGSAALAADAAALAAGHATTLSAHADAAHHWQIVADMVRIAEPSDRTRRAAALRGCASAWQRIDRVRDVQRAVQAAVGVSREAGDLDGAAQAAGLLNHASIFPNQPYGTVDAALLAMLTALLDSMSPSDSAARALVMSAMATEMSYDADTERRDRISIEAIAMARRVGDPTALAQALHARTFALKAPESVPARRALASELLQLAGSEQFGADLLLVAELQLALADFALGNFDAAGRGVTRCVPLLDRPVGDALRSQLGLFRSHLDFVQGRHEVGMRGAADALQLYRLERPEDADVFVLAQHWMFGHDLGGLDIDHLRSLPATPGVQGYAQAFQWWTTALLFDIGRHDLAVRRLSELGDPIPDRRLDYLTIFIDVAAGMCAVAMGDKTSAVALAERLTPWRGRWAHAGTAAGSLGLVDLTLARLDEVLGRVAAARGGFADAVEGHERLGTPGYLARSLLHQGSFHARTGDSIGARASWQRAEAVAAAAGLAPIVEQIRGVSRDQG